ncbi:replicative DNA helicase [Nonomuraea sp. NPDC046802]|uniref:replicative DNA helicase n=1 Tax=Nonomuraea sp. NPDC046802 TaxID=3154919 RepID=UPI00340B14A9
MGAGPGFERTPPHNIDAEQSVLGGMILSKDAIADVVEILRSDDFYRPAHQMVYDVITDLYGRGEPADAVTVFDELQKRGEMARVGGAAYLHTLTAVVPTAANAGYYAKIVREQAILRRLIEAGTRIVSYGYGGQNEEVDDLVDRAQAEIYKVTERRTSEDYAPLADIMPGALDELEAIGSRSGQMVGVPTGFQDLDTLTNGLHPGQMIVVAARPAIGKALALDTPLPTPAGWTTMGQVQVGDELIGADGRPTRVVAATEVLHGRPCFEVEFDDGTVVVADAQHQWRTVAHGASDRRRVVTTEELAKGHAVEVAAPFVFDERELPLPPYALGAQLDGHIPMPYLRASERQRRELLRGLLDAQGTTTAGGKVCLAAEGRRLAQDVMELVLSLGHQAVMRAEAGSSTHYMINFTTEVRNIVDVRPIPSRPVRCVQVDNDDHMYLASRSCVPTHNSTLGLDFARSAAIKHGMTTVIFSLEMSRNEITMRLLSAEARVALHAMRSGLMTDDDWTRLARRMSEVAEAPLFIDDSPNMSMMEIRAKCRRLKQRNDLRFVVIDYLQLMSSPKKTESRQNEVSEISRAIKLLAKELEVPVIAISQLNRGPEQRTDKRPAVSDLRESGCLTAATRVMRADTGAEVSLGELLESGARDIPVWSLDERLRLVPRTMTHVFPSGVKQVYRVRLRSGREVEATANHPFLTYDGWRALGDLAAGTRVAVPRHVPAPLNLAPCDEDELVRAAGRGDTSLPEGLSSLPKRQIALFLRHLWAAGGRVEWDGRAHLSYSSASRQLVDDLARLLLRFNVMTRVERRDGTYLLDVTSAEDQVRFLDDVGVHACHEEAALECAARLREVTGDTGLDPIPPRARTALRAEIRREQARLGRVAAVLDDSEMELLATNDVFWDEIAAVEPLGEQPVYDATVLGTHNFVANGISLHNSIEQDADMVILLHREDAYERESPRAGEADLIVAKHRNGPTATVTVAFQGHYSRFVDMAQH